MLLLMLAVYSSVLRLQLAQDVDCMVCPLGYYRCGDDCAVADSESGSGSSSSGSGSSGSGSATDLDFPGCALCHSSCVECFGPSNTQCYECAGLFLLVPDLAPNANNETNVSNCDRFVTTDASRPVLHCVEQCPQGKYQNGSECFDCSSNCLTCVNGSESGCLTCSSYSYEGSCVNECPAHTLPSDDNQCLPVTHPLALSVDLIILIIIAIATVIILVIFVITLFWCLGLYAYKKKISKAENFNSKRNPVTLADSFRRVTTDFGNQMRISRHRDNIRVIGSNEESGLSQPLSPGLDPYTTSNAFELQEASMHEAEDHNTDAMEEDENMYVQMNPSCSSSINSHGEANVELDPPVPVRTTSDRRQSGLHSPSSANDKPEDYVNPKELSTSVYYANQTAIDSHLLTSGSQMPHDALHNGLEDDNEQELYEDMSGGLEATPTRPPRSILCAEPEVAQGSLQHHDSMGNEYVAMTPVSTDILNSGNMESHSYVNVPSSKDGRLPAVHGKPQPTYYNIVRNGASALTHDKM